MIWVELIIIFDTETGGRGGRGRERGKGGGREDGWESGLGPGNEARGASE